MLALAAAASPNAAIVSIAAQTTPIPTETTLLISPMTVGALQPVDLGALVRPVPPAGGAPLGEVEFLLDGTTVLGRSPLGLVAGIRVNGLSIGANSIMARYIPNGEFAGSVSAPANRHGSARR
jgi:hypothetical protein